MWQLVVAFGEIVLRRRGPESLPDSDFLVLFLLAAYVLVTLVDLTMIGGLTRLDLVLLSANIALLLAFVFATLTFFKVERRYRQTISAIIGAEIVITLTYLPFAIVAIALGIDVAEGPFLWLRLGFLFWWLFVAACVLARSLSQPLIVGMMFAILYLHTSLSISYLLTPATD